MNYKRLWGNIFPFFILGFTLIVYYGIIIILYFEYDFFIGKYMVYLKNTYLIIFHIFYFLVIYCYFKTMLTNPGQPPKYWGFFYEDPDEKRRRYCITCFGFKPERCHHCSTCGICILVMDHHCIWLNNCVGFYNRKFFFLLILFCNILSLLGILGSIYPYFKFIILLKLNKNNIEYLIKFIFINVIYILVIIFFFIIFNFFKFHLNLIEKNSTTLENLGEQSGKVVEKIYDMGKEFNYKFALGKKKYCWLIPIMKFGGESYGDGVVQQSKNLTSNIENYDDQSMENIDNWDKDFENKNPITDKYYKSNFDNYYNKNILKNNNNNDEKPLLRQYIN